MRVRSTRALARLCALAAGLAAWALPVEPHAVRRDPVTPRAAGPALPVLHMLTNSSVGAERVLVRAVRDAAAERFDVDALPPRTPVDVWTVGTDVVAFRVVRTDDDGGAFAALRAHLDGEETWVSLSGGTLTGPLSSRPVSYRAISSNIGVREHPVRKKMKFHAGTDFAASMGTPITAIADGVVVKAARSWTAGRYLVLRHDTGHETRLMHLDRKVHGIEEGVRVRKGDVVGFVGKSGRVTGPHLHFELRDERGVPLDAARVRWPADGALTDARTLRDLRARFAALDGMRSGHALELADPTRAPAPDARHHEPPSATRRGQVPPVVPVRSDGARARVTPPLPRRRRALPAGASLFDDVDEVQLEDPLVRRALLLAAEFA